MNHFAGTKPWFRGADSRRILQMSFSITRRIRIEKAMRDLRLFRCGVAGRLKDDIYYHKLMLDAYPSKQENVDERRASLTEDGMKALR